MIFTKKYPITLAERLELGKGEVQFSGSFQDFIELLEVCDYPIEYQNENIIAMSIASDPHEQIVANFLYTLVKIFKGNKNYKRYGSNRHVYLEIPKCAYSPDASIVKGEPNIFEYPKGKTANLNPWLVVEVISKSSRNKDWGDKLTNYRNCPSMKYIIYAEQDSCLITVFKRLENSKRWGSTDFDDLNQNFEIEGKSISLADIYENVDLK